MGALVAEGAGTRMERGLEEGPRKGTSPKVARVLPTLGGEELPAAGGVRSISTLIEITRT